MTDVLVIGAGPAGLAIAAALGNAGLRVAALSPTPADTPWPNTYGIWCDELEPLGLTHLLGHRWQNTVAFVDNRAIPLHREYALFDNDALQRHLLRQSEEAHVDWHIGLAAEIRHTPTHSTVKTEDGTQLSARLIIDASGHTPVFVRRPAASAVAYQAAYGIVGRFSVPPVDPNQLVLMDWRADHLDPTAQADDPTFLYAMDLGDGRFFVEETSLARDPAFPLGKLEQRLYQRLAHRGIVITQIEHVERCLFPMNLPLPDLAQPVLGYGGAASMVHPASGYQVGAALTMAPIVAEAVARCLADPRLTPAQIACAGWAALWPQPRLRNRALYLFGLHNLLRFDRQQTADFFRTFFALPRPLWSGYLSNTLSTLQLLQTMLLLFGRTSHRVRLSLVRSLGSGGGLLKEMW